MDRALLMKLLLPLGEFMMAKEASLKKKIGERGSKMKYSGKFAFFPMTSNCSRKPAKALAVSMIACISSYQKPELELLRKITK